MGPDVGSCQVTNTTLRGMDMYCPKCGAKLPDDASFCNKCGAHVEPIESGGPTPQEPIVTAAPQEVAPTPAPVEKKPRHLNPVLAGVLCALGIIAVVACVLLMRPSSQVSQTGQTSSSSSTSSVSDDGVEIDTFARPTIATTLVSSSMSMSSAPALARYLNSINMPSSDGSSSTSTSSTSSSSNGSASSSSGSDAVTNPYSTLSDLKPASNLSNVVNLGDFNLTAQDKSLLEQNMFAVDTRYGSSEFFDIYEENRYGMLPNFVTTDSMMHSYHLYFSYLQKNCEKTYLSADLLSLSQTMLQTSSDQLTTLSGTEWEAAAKRNVTFFAVACCLLDPSTTVPDAVASDVSSEVSKIQDATAVDECAITGEEEDYSQYKPRGYYEGDEQLERYFRAMMWYGRINFTEKDEDLDRSALLATLALDGGTNGTVNSDWEAIYTVTSFFAGASDDLSYYEYYPIFAHCYGDGATVDDLAGNDQAWESYHALTATMPAPKISSVIVGDESKVTDDDIKGFRLMGQRFSIDESIFQQLVYDNVGDKSNPRLLPSALDLPAALGSDEALGILKDEGKTNYTNYDSQMEGLRTTIANSDDSIWTASLYSQWLYTLNPLLVTKGSGYPDFMQSEAWTRKNLQSYLGSYTELKHDTVLYSKQVMTEMGGGDIEKDDRGYVEPEPDVYARLANLTQATSDGLSRYGMLSSDDAADLGLLKDLATKLETISEEELSGKALSDDEYDLIRTYGGQIEHFWQVANPTASKSGSRSNEFPAAVVVDVATDNDDGTVLELATGRVSTIYVLVPIDGELHLCAGGTFSYYEFDQPQSNRLTDSQWRETLGITGSSSGSTSVPDQPEWVNTFQTSN